MIAYLSNPDTWAALFTLTVLEIVLGIDNLVFLAITSGRLPAHQQPMARKAGLFLALILRIGLLTTLTSIARLTQPVFVVDGFAVSWRDLVLGIGGLYLIYKGATEIHETVEGGGGEAAARARADRWMDWQFHYADAQRDAFLQCVRRRADQRDPAVIAASAAASGAMMQILDAALASQPWLTGADFGIADVPMGVYAHTFFTLDIPRPRLPHAEAWYARLCERPGFAQQVMIPLT